MARGWIAALPVIVAMAACTSEPEPGPPEPPPPSDACGASEHQKLIGLNRAILGGGALGKARLIGPETAVTADYRPDRLNVEYDEDGVITKVSCF